MKFKVLVKFLIIMDLNILCFVDDCSRTTWLYLLKEQSEVPVVFESFFNEIKNQFGVSIQILRFDNALEYYHSSLTRVCENNTCL